MPKPNESSSIIPLYTARSLNAVETARATTINSAGYLIKGTFRHGGR